MDSLHERRVDIFSKPTTFGSMQSEILQVQLCIFLIHKQSFITFLLCLSLTVSNAEMGLIGPIECHPIDEMKTVMDTNFFGFVRLLKEVLPDMKRRKKGHIVIISSVMGIQGEDETLS